MKQIITSFFALAISVQLFAQIPTQETNALTDIYESTQGNQWNQQWDLSQSVTDWPGVTIVDGHVTEISMLFNNLNGPIPASISALTELRVLELSFNKISGALPESIGELSKLELLALNGNNLSGTIPQDLIKLTDLRQLHLSSNQLTGELPVGLEQLEALEIFNVFDNNMSGNLPILLAKSRNIKEFVVAENRFQNTQEISSILLSNSGGVDFKENTFNPSAKSIIAIETSDDEN
ncbi:MAG: hypothetical protein K0U54_05610 [Bacteroidetes bacterium]|nr:hypothetical protein [Bacteroidota bacterium]